jgi:hypothetical protein
VFGNLTGESYRIICPRIGPVGSFAEVSSDSDGKNSWGPWYASDPPTAPFDPIKGAQPQQGQGQQEQPSYGQPQYQQPYGQQQPTYTGHQAYNQQQPPPPYGQQPQDLPPAFRMPSSQPPRRRPRKLLYGVLVGGVAVVAAIAAVVVLVLKPGSGPAHTTGYLPNGSSPGQDAEQITSAFLSAWSHGNLAQASKYTDHPAAALKALEANQKYLNLRKLSGSPQSATVAPGAGTRQQVTYALTADVATSSSATARTGRWSYQTSLVAYQQPNSQWWYIKWSPDVIAPNLTSTTHLAAVSVAPQIVSVTDAQGGDLTSYGDAGLNNIAQILMKNGSSGSKGSPGLYVQIETNSGKAVANSQAVVVAPSNVPSLATTIDPTAERAARAAVTQHAESSMVAIQPSTGKILAIANNAGYNDFALTARVAPGSTGKIISSTALFSQGVLNANSPDECPPTFTVDGITFHNDGNETEPASTPVTTDFAASCNNAFDRWYTHEENGGLAAAAKKYYGLDRPWDIGLGESSTYYYTPPNATGAELAQEMFGEGQIAASPLGMASVAATVYTGSFKQPFVVPGARQVTATSLPPSVDAGMKQMMRAVVTSGTAGTIGFGPNVYAKTGTADIIGQKQPNSWFVAFDTSKDVAVACLVVDAGYGAQYAGPEVRTFLDGYR